MRMKLITIGLSAVVVLATGCKTLGIGGKTDPDVAKEAAEIAAASGTNVDAATHFSMGTKALGKEGTDLAAARKNFERAVKADPTFAVATYNLGVIHEKEGRVEDAAQRYREAFDADPTMDLAVNNLGVILETNGQAADARALYEQALERNPETVHARIRLARMAHESGNLKVAARLAREALQFDGKSLGAYRLLARIYAETKKNTLARLIAVRGQKLSEGDAELTFALAIVARNENEIAIARELLRKVIKTDAQHVEARVMLADLALRNRDWKTASGELQALAKIAPSNPTVHNSLGLALKGQGKFADAKAAYEAAINADSSFSAAVLNLGILQLRHLDDPEAAKASFNRYLDISSTGTKKANQLLEEAVVLIDAKEEEARAMEMAKQAEEEARRQAEEDAKRAAEEAKNKPPEEEKPPADQPEPEPEPEMEPEPEPEPPPVVEEPKPKPKPKRKKRRKKKKKKKPDAAPEQDDDFFD
jgi:Tfp pilus assembly protein PilF